jgi:Magnesium chelatase, subunit ChlI
MTLAEAVETTRIPRVAGLTGARAALVTTHPCRAPHHTISNVGLIGGGHVPMPGEVSRVHHGVRCLDARSECRRHALEVLRQLLAESVTGRQPLGRQRSCHTSSGSCSGAAREEDLPLTQDPFHAIRRCSG